MVLILVSPPPSFSLLTFLLSRLMPEHSSVKYVSRQTELLLTATFPPSQTRRQDSLARVNKNSYDKQLLEVRLSILAVTPQPRLSCDQPAGRWSNSAGLISGISGIPLAPLSGFPLQCTTTFSAHANARSAHATHTGPSSGSNTLAVRLTQIRDVLIVCNPFAGLIDNWRVFGNEIGHIYFCTCR